MVRMVLGLVNSVWRWYRRMVPGPWRTSPSTVVAACVRLRTPGVLPSC